MDTKPMETNDEVRGRRLPRWLLALLPLLLLGLLVAAFLALDPLRSFRGAFPPLETLSVQRVLFPAPGDVRLEVINGGPEPVTIAPSNTVAACALLMVTTCKALPPAMPPRSVIIPLASTRSFASMSPLSTGRAAPARR